MSRGSGAFADNGFGQAELMCRRPACATALAQHCGTVEQERNGSGDYPRDYLNCGQLESTEPSYAGDSLFSLVRELWERCWGRSGNFSSGQGVAVPAPLRSSCGNSVYWHEGGGWALPGLSGEFSVPAGGMWGVAASDHEGEPRSRWPRAFWLNVFTSLAVGFECVFLIFMAQGLPDARASLRALVPGQARCRATV
jgi:hypothetical protein